MGNVEANIREIDRVDSGSYGFRYPVGKNRVERSLPNAPDLVNLRLLHEAMEALANFLSCVGTELHTRLDCVIEMEAEAHQDYSPE